MKKLALCGTVLIFIILSCNSNSYDDSNKNRNEIVEIGQEKVPDNVDLKENREMQVKLDAAFSRFLKKFEKVNLPYRIEPKETLDYDKITLEEQVNYLSKAEDLNKDELKQMADYAKFYFISNPFTTSKFNAVVYARAEMGSNYYLLCTFNNSGKLISSIEFAMYQLIGAGPQAGQEYIMYGQIDKDLQVKTSSDGKTYIYQINDEGKIIRK